MNVGHQDQADNGAQSLRQSSASSNPVKTRAHVKKYLIIDIAEYTSDDRDYQECITANMTSTTGATEWAHKMYCIVSGGTVGGRPHRQCESYP